MGSPAVVDHYSYKDLIKPLGLFILAIFATFFKCLITIILGVFRPSFFESFATHSPVHLRFVINSQLMSTLVGGINVGVLYVYCIE